MLNNIADLLGRQNLSMQVITDRNLTEAVYVKKQKRRLKSRRWVKKYRKKYLKLLPSKDVYLTVDNKIICHPEMVSVIVKMLTENKVIKVRRSTVETIKWEPEPLETEYLTHEKLEELRMKYGFNQSRRQCGLDFTGIFPIPDYV